MGLGSAHSLELSDHDRGIMDFLSRVVEKFPLWNAGVFLAFAGVFIWFLTRLDEETRRHVELRRHLWEATSTHEIEFKKTRSLAKLVYSIFIAISLICAMVIMYAYQVVG